MTCLQLCPDTLPVVPAVLLGVLGVSGRDSSHGELVLKDSTGDIICEVRVSMYMFGDVYHVYHICIARYLQH